MSIAEEPRPSSHFLIGGGTMGDRMRALDWAKTPIGDPENWPPALKTLVGVLLGADQPMFVAWGPERVLIYNDAYRPLLGSKDRQALGRPFLDVWAEARDQLAAMFDRVFAGEPIHMDDLEMTLDRGAGPREAHFAFSYTPVRDETGAIAGLFCACAEISEQVMARRQLAAERDRQHAMLQQMPGFVGLMSGPGHVYDYVNDTYVRVGGSRDYIGRGVREVFPELAGQGYFELLDQAYRSGEPFSARAVPILLAGDADERFIDFIFQPTRDASGAVSGIFVGGYDVTESKETEAALAASEAEFRTFAQAMPAHVWAAAPDGMLNWFNQRVYDYNGVTPGTLDGTQWATQVHADDLVAAREKWAAALASGADYETEFRLRRADGVYRWHLARAIPIRDDAGQIIRWIGTNTDIHEQKVTAAALARLNATLEQEVALRTADRDRMWRNAQDILLVVDMDGIFRSVSPSVEAILGWSADELIGHSVFDFIVPDDAAVSHEGMRQLAAGQTRAVENRYRHKDGGHRWFTWIASAEDGLIYATGRHATAEKEAAEQLAIAQEALRQSHKMEAVGQLTGGIAHDFNNMLAVVIGALDLLTRRIGTDDERVKRYIDAAVDAARRAAALTQRLLAFSRQQPLQPETVDPNRLITDMSHLLRGSLGADVRLETVLAGGQWRIHVDPNQLENVILNLAVNARDAMAEGGRLTIETQNAHLDARYAAAHPGVAAGQYVLIAVTDTGSGMPTEVVEKAFDPFFTTKEVGKGTGLGLSQVYGFIKQSDGHVKIYSEPGEGTTVKIYLPRLIGDEAHAIADESRKPPTTGEAGEVILVVDDEASVRQLSVDALQELGYRVLAADGAAAALRLLDAHPEIVLLFTDVVMPDMNGRKLADEAHRLYPALKILFTTGYTRNAVVHNGVLDAGVELIGKPFTIDELAAKVRDVLDAA